MPRIITKVRRLRLNRAAQEGRPITLQEAADAMGIERAQLNRIELGKTTAIRFDILTAICRYYGVGVEEVLEYDPNIQTSNHAGRALAAA
jgi:DNA-binding Xre family transcriptional regulator